MSHYGAYFSRPCVIDSRAAHKSLLTVTAFINETQVFICDNSNFINNPLYTSMYIQAVSSEDLPLSRGIPIYIQACHVIVIRISLVISLWEQA